MKTNRDSGIELLRILSALAVIILHFNGMEKALVFSSGLTHELLIVLESACICAVDVFIVISGYYLCLKAKRTWDKPLYLFLLMSVINVSSYLIKACVSGVDFDLITIIHWMLPPKNYFVTLYIVLYIISPFINIVLNRSSKKGRTVFIIVLFAIFSIYSTLTDVYQLIVHKEIMGVSPVGAYGSQHGYTIIGFSLCYSLGAWLRLNNVIDRFKNWELIASVVFCITIIYLWCKGETIFCGSFENATSYTNPFVLLLSVLFVMLFARMQFHSIIINSLAKAAFVCFIFHLQVLPYLKVSEFALKGGAVLFVFILVSLVSLYIISWLIWFVLDIILRPFIKKMAQYEIFSLEVSPLS